MPRYQVTHQTYIQDDGWITHAPSVEKEKFNSRTKQELFVGLKSRVAIEHLMTGRELCAIIGIDYDAIVLRRKVDAEENLEYFLTKLLDIDTVRERIRGKLEEVEEVEEDQE